MIREILNRERKYCDDLTLLLDTYASNERRFWPDGEHKLIFRNAGGLKLISEDFAIDIANRLSEGATNSMSVGDIMHEHLVKYCPALVIYAKHTTHAKITMESSCAHTPGLSVNLHKLATTFVLIALWDFSYLIFIKYVTFRTKTLPDLLQVPISFATELNHFVSKLVASTPSSHPDYSQLHESQVLLAATVDSLPDVITDGQKSADTLDSIHIPSTLLFSSVHPYDIMKFGRTVTSIGIY